MRNTFIVKSRNDWLWLSGICFLMLGLCLVARLAEPMISRDGALYLELVRVWHENGDFQAVLEYWKGYWIPPLYLYAVQLIMYCGCSAEFAGIGINILLGCSLPVICYFIALEIGMSRKIALCSALLTALNPVIIGLVIEPQRESLYLFFCGLLIYFIIRGLKRMEWRCFIIAGICGGCSFLTRYETLEMIPLFILAVTACIIANWRNWKKYVLYMLIFFAFAGTSFWGLIHVMGVQGHLTRYYEQYYQGKYKNFERTWQEGSSK